MVERAVVIVGAEREEHADLGARLRGRADDRLQEVLTRPSASVNTSWNWSMTRRRRPPWGIVGSVGRRLGPASGARSLSSPCGTSVAAAMTASTSASGLLPGAIWAMTHWSDPSIAPSRSRGMRPAAMTLDLPDPDGPTSATRFASWRSERSSFVTRSSRPKKSAASRSNARRPLRVAGCRGGRCRRPA